MYEDIDDSETVLTPGSEAYYNAIQSLPPLTEEEKKSAIRPVVGPTDIREVLGLGIATYNGVDLGNVTVTRADGWNPPDLAALRAMYDGLARPTPIQADPQPEDQFPPENPDMPYCQCMGCTDNRGQPGYRDSFSYFSNMNIVIIDQG